MNVYAQSAVDDAMAPPGKHILSIFAQYFPYELAGSRTYEGPIKNLYLCGAGAWPGGCVMGAPGHNAAQEVIANLTEPR